jgi:hypothetical protein
MNEKPVIYPSARMPASSAEIMALTDEISNYKTLYEQEAAKHEQTKSELKNCIIQNNKNEDEIQSIKQLTSDIQVEFDGLRVAMRNLIVENKAQQEYIDKFNKYIEKITALDEQSDI